MLSSPSLTWRLVFRLVLLNAALLLTACQQTSDAAAGAARTPPQQPTLVSSTPIMATRKPAITPTSVSTPPLPSPSPTQPPEALPLLCSPLDGIALPELLEIISFPYDPPAPGMDDGHHGIDFSYYRRGEQSSIHGLPVRSALEGTVAAAITDRPPYGNMLIIETSLSILPEEWPRRLGLPDPQPRLPENLRLNCPPVTTPDWDSPDRSLYLLYGHLDKPPALSAGDRIACGDVIGAVGNSGMSGNPHLHLEVRVGPAGMSFPAMAHYDNAATDEEMGLYCTWRISGLFQLVDPGGFLLTSP